MGAPEQIDQLRKLWLLDLVVAQGCFRKAAVLAKVTRSAVSQTVKSLEKAHGRNLLVRGKGIVSATPYCLEVLGKARPILHSLDALAPTAAGLGDVPAMSWLDIGAFDSLAIVIMPKLLARLEAQCPGVRITVKIARSGKLATMVRKGELCMAIVVENDLIRDLTVIPLAEDRLGIYVSAAAAPGKPLPFGMISPGPDGQPLYLSKFLKEAGVSKSPAFTSDSLEALMEAAAFGSIAAILPSRVAARRRHELVEITPAALTDRAAGRHRLCLISGPNCDARENDFLAREVRSLLTAIPDGTGGGVANQ